MKVFSILMGVMFLGFAALQLNDLEQYGNADFWSWIVIYLVSAAVFFYQLKGGVPRSWLTAWMGFAYGGFVFRMQDPAGNFRFENFMGNWFLDESGAMIQQTNEAGGMFIVGLTTSILLLLRRAKN